MNFYEHTLIARQDTSPSQIKQIQEKYTKIIENNEGDILKFESWGLMNLSYLIKKNKKGGLQYHRLKNECGILLSGKLKVKFLNKKKKIVSKILKPGQCFHFPPGVIHQEIALEKCLIIEASSPHLNDRAVYTASDIQVRSPINSKSIGLWKNYKDMLKPSIEMLSQTERYQDCIQ